MFSAKIWTELKSQKHIFAGRSIISKTLMKIRATIFDRRGQNLKSSKYLRPKVNSKLLFQEKKHTPSLPQI